ncbi:MULTISPECIES: ROK family transcriptional regulator [unclassified Arthrobacter]|uniref:ROK family transcriptional regulator n=1 Tax=unclassified Arthrobacter TaxID=235627 RepID=UPI0024DF63C7|nr:MULTISPECIES: ROK family transcriptional regulator [unclassified Arthrobacter]MCC9145970.1 ROK family protein [Arthrobacter sp. zg-Y919]MDK1277199.1 ROK family transcriptional regulator [Arthrobacter sp. zg.Y919]WIB03713.1 ROK family transcriptional regulator [Arthrobacter sp. zg-Y919]
MDSGILSAPAPAPAGRGTDRSTSLSRILTLLHRSGPLSRADLTRLTGFNRSTVGTLTADLTSLGLAYETDPPAGRVGRPSPLVHPNERVAAVVVHPDVDAVTVGLVGLGGRVHRRVRHDTLTPPSVEETVSITRAVLAGMAPELAAMDRITGVGVAVPGLTRTSDGHVLLAPHLGWRNEPLAAPLSQALDLPVFAGNDATLGSVAESLFGAAVDTGNAVYLNGSASGIGGGIIVAGVPLRGADGYAGELGHTLVRSGGEPCHCGRRGCLETEVNLDRLLDVLGLDRADQDTLDAAMEQPQTAEVRAEVDRQLDQLAVALTNFVNIFNPEAIVLGGFLGTLFAANQQRLVDAVAAESMAGLGQRVQLRRAALRSELLLVGAAELAFAPVLAAPSK